MILIRIMKTLTMKMGRYTSDSSAYAPKRQESSKYGILNNIQYFKLK
jgi:hypothetical protein